MRQTLSLSIVIALTIGVATIMAPVNAHAAPQKRILSLYALRQASPSVEIFDEAYRRVFADALGTDLDFYSEVLDLQRFPEAEAFPTLRDFIRDKYRRRQFDLVIATGPTVMRFVGRYAADLFPGTPVVFAQGEGQRPIANSTGLFQKAAIRETVDLALRLQPHTQHVYVVSGFAEFDEAYRERTRKQLASLREGLDVTYLTLPLSMLLDRVARLPSDAIILFLTMVEDGPGGHAAPHDVFQQVARAASVPIYSFRSPLLGQGIVGGRVGHWARDAELAAALGMRVLRGERAGSIPPREIDTNTDEVDWRQLQRWNLSEALLPPGATIRFHEPTTWEQYWLYVAGGVALVLLQSTLIGALAVQRTRRQRVELELRESESHFRAMADTAPVMIWRSGVDKRCDFFNQPWLSFTGRRLDQELGDGWADGVHPDDLDRCVDTYRTAFDAREPFRMEYRLRRFDGEYRLVLDSGIARWAPDGQFAGYIGSCIDITDRQQAELALQAAHADLSRVSRLTALGEFAASVAHEVRQPLTAILINARTSLRGIANHARDLDDVRVCLLDIVEASQRAAEMITRNQELFRHHTVRTAVLDINDVVREVLLLAAVRLTESSVTVVTRLADNLPLISGDRIELQQVLLNLIANAIDAMEGETQRRIEISSSRESNTVRVSVSDTGIGLDGVDIQRMFTMSYTTKATGTGVGLSISRAIVDAHGGRLWSEQNVDCGATFVFTIPVRSAGKDIEEPRLQLGV